MKLTGAAPQPRLEKTGKDTGVCGEQVATTRLRLGDANGVADSFVYLDEAATSSFPSRPATTLTIDQRGCSYVPHAMIASSNSSIEIVNDDPVLHNVHAKQGSQDAETLFNIAQPIRGQRTKVDQQLKPGIVSLTCEAGHPWMTAYILVANHPYAAITGKNGEFVIENVPAGTHTLKMWHEGVVLKRVVPSLQLFEYESPYETTKDVVVPAGGEVRVDFDLVLRAARAGATANASPAN